MIVLTDLAICSKVVEYEDEETVEKRCEWKDTDRGDYLYISSMEISDKDKLPPREFKIIGKDNETITFILMTNKLFQEKVAKKVAGQLSFKNDDELQQYYLKTSFV